MSTAQVYIVYDGDPDGPIDRMAHAVMEGAEAVAGASALLHTAQQASVDAMVAADAIILGSPNWHGMTADLKGVVDQTGLIWEQGKLVGKVGAAFTSGWSRSGGQEITLLTLLHTLLAHGMVIVGLPGAGRGSYYGPTARRPARRPRASARTRPPGGPMPSGSSGPRRMDEIDGGLFTAPAGPVVERRVTIWCQLPSPLSPSLAIGGARAAS
jgi:NAD(P)H dehydrogenase (quinone)